MNESKAYISIFDTRQKDRVLLLDALNFDKSDQPIIASFLTDDGLNLTITPKKLIVIDTMVTDLVHSSPKPGETGILVNDPIVLTFNQPIAMPDQYTLADHIRMYENTGAENPEPLAFDLVLADDYQTLTLTHIPLDFEKEYKLALSSVPDSRRSWGLFDYQIVFQTASSGGPKPEIISIQPDIVSTSGGQLTVTIKIPDMPAFF